MDAGEAREHLAMVDRILARAENEPVKLIPGLVPAVPDFGSRTGRRQPASFIPWRSASR